VIINRAEAHGYFRGQIDFLLNFSDIKAESLIQRWSVEQHGEAQGKFQNYFTKASMMFDEKGLRPLPDFLWERALLCVGNYLLPSSRNYSFLVNSSTEQGSWKRLLRGANQYVSECREFLKQLLDRIDTSIDLEAQLSVLIENATELKPWVEALVSTPEALAYCKSRYIRFESGQIYLMSKSQMNGMHAELFSYALYYKMKANIARFSSLVMYYLDVSGTEMEPSFYISCKKNEVPLRIFVRFSEDCFVVGYVNSGAALESHVANVLHELGFMENGILRESRVRRVDAGSWFMQFAASVTGESGQENALE